jgi:putative methionine-R-sulfoxide reductase with GAF domain
MNVRHEKLPIDSRAIVAAARDRVGSLQKIANLLRSSGAYRWVGLYDINSQAGLVMNVVWSGPGAPEHPTFPVTKGLTSAAISARKIVNVGDVSADPRYLTAFGTIRSEIIVPVFDAACERVVGTIDIESEKPNAFSHDVEALLVACSDVIRPLWQ